MALTVSQKLDALVNQSGVKVNTITITDTSNYSFNGLDVNNYVGILTISFGGVIIYSNANYSLPDITVGLGTKELPLVVDANSNPVTGTYQVTLSIRNINTLEVISNTTSYVYDYVAPVVSIAQTPDGYASTFSSSDNTDYTGVSYTRTHEVVVPAGSGISDTTNTNATISYAANIWSGVFTTNITSSITYVNALLTVSDEVVGTLPTTIYKLNRNDVYDAITAFNTAYNTAVGANPKLSTTYGVLSNRIDGYVREYTRGLEEQDTQKCYDALLEIAELLSPDYISTLFTVTEEITPFDFTITTDAEIINFINSITASTDDLNKIKDLNVSANRVVFTDGSKMVTDSDFTFDGSDLSIPSGGKFKVSTQDIADVYSPKNSPTFTGTVVLPSTTSIGTVSNTEIGYLDGVTSGIQGQLNLKAPIADPTFTGIPAAPTASISTNTTQIATTAFVKAVIAALVDSAPETLDTLNELAAALGDDPNFATTVTNLIGLKAPILEPSFTGTVAQFAGNINLASGKKYKINNVDLSYSDVGAQQLNQKLTDISGLTLAEGDILYVNSSGNIVKLAKGVTNTILTMSGNTPVWDDVADVFSISLPALVNKAASANARNTHDASVTSYDVPMTKLKTITLTNGLTGVIRISFRMASSFSGENVNGEVRKNGTLIGATQSTTSTILQIKSQDITVTFNAGDTCELWASPDVADSVTVDQFRLSYDDLPIVAVPSSNS